jgi:thymidylate kinase
MLVIQKVFAENPELSKYCFHWKSCHAIQEALNGHGDLDLYVDQSKYKTVVKLLETYGAICVSSFTDLSHTSTQHLLLHEESIEKTLHIHLYSQALSGDSLVKCYNLTPFLYQQSSTYSSSLIPCVNVDVELLLLCIRLQLKQDNIIETRLLNQDLSNIMANIDYLLASGAHLNHCHNIQSDIISLCSKYLAKCLETRTVPKLNRNERTIAKHIFLPYRRISKFSYYQHLLMILTHLFLRNLKGKKGYALYTATSGVTCAFVAPPASGKTSTINNIYSLLSPTGIRISKQHMGRPLSHPFLKPLSMLLNIYKAVSNSKQLNSEEFTRSSSASKASVLFSLKSLLIAFMRYLLFLEVTVLKKLGYVVLCDRYPFDQPGYIDGPSVKPILSSNSLITKYICSTSYALERRFYSMITPPNIIINLEIDLDTALARHRERLHNEYKTINYVMTRHRMYHLPLTPTHIHNIDAKLPLGYNSSKIISIIFKFISEKHSSR